MSEKLIAEFREHAVFRIRESAEKVRGCLDPLDDEAFWHQPTAHTNSPAQLLRHLQGNITQYILSGLGHTPDLRKREEEFRPPAIRDRALVESGFFDTVARAVEMIGSVSGHELITEKRVQGFEFSGLGIILHVVEHLSYHTGQFAYLTKREKNMDLGFYRDVDLNQTNE